MLRAAAEMEPLSRMLSNSLALPGPIRAPEASTMLIFSVVMPVDPQAQRSAPAAESQSGTPAILPNREFNLAH